MRKIISQIANWFEKLFYKPTNTPPKRLELKDVKNDSYIVIEHWRFFHNQGQVKVLNNDVQSEKILVEVEWSNPREGTAKFERWILDYDSSQLENFHLLNSVPFKSIKLKDPIVDNTKKLEELEVELNIAVKNNNFEKASEIRDKIKKLKK